MSIRKRTWKTAKGEVKEAWVFDYVDQAGKRHIKTFDKKKDATTYQTTVMGEVRDGTHTASSQSVKVKEAADKWLGTGEKNGLERSTLDQYRQHITLHINPYLGDHRLSELTAPLVREFEDRLRKGTPAPGQKEAKSRSAALVRKVLVSLGSLLGDAQERGLVARNVVRDLRSKRTRGKERRSERRQKGKLKIGVDIPTREEIKAIVGAVAGRWRPLLLTAIFTGLRASELRGLLWSDVDFDARQIHVRQRADRYNEIGAPKSEAGERVVPLPPLVLNTLREWKLSCPRRKEKKDDEGKLHLVFPTGTGNVESLGNIINRGLVPPQLAGKVSVPVVAADGTPRLDEEGKPILAAKYTGMHALRHFYASWCINRKADGGLELPPKVVQERLGHSSIVMTMDVYGHLFPRGDDGSELAEAERSLLA
ncbi:tyrosine-type recombinase/integrase [Labrys okinawensis]|uniref:tyrosine-type recombinase/integrase n=1 Tax=Labrys okinawensis TaxID=346911 RepID=UPI0039BCA1F3